MAQVQKKNYQKELDLILDGILKAGTRPRLLLHACCAPCSSYVLEYLSGYFDITLFFYNPNMDSREEYDKRRAELERLVASMGLDIKVLAPDYDPKEFYETVRGHEKDPERGERCGLCFRLRLRRTAELAREARDRGEPYDYICTTLSISPLKDAALLNFIGQEEASRLGEHFLSSDFKKREGYKRSIELSEKYGLYRQDYCGCVFSKVDRGA